MGLLTGANRGGAAGRTAAFRYLFATPKDPAELGPGAFWGNARCEPAVGWDLVGVELAEGFVPGVAVHETEVAAI